MTKDYILNSLDAVATKIFGNEFGYEPMTTEEIAQYMNVSKARALYILDEARRCHLIDYINNFWIIEN